MNMKQYGYSQAGNGVCKRIAKWTMTGKDADAAQKKHGVCGCKLMNGDNCHEVPFRQ